MTSDNPDTSAERPIELIEGEDIVRYSYESRRCRIKSLLKQMFIADEVGAFKTKSNISAMSSGQLNVENPLSFYITTAYANDQSVMHEELAFLRKMYAEEEEEEIFALLYYAEIDHLWDDHGLLMSNPLRIEQNYETIRNKRKLALEMPNERIEYLTKHMNHFLPTDSGEEFINIDDLRACKIDEFDWTGREVWLGLDLSISGDNTSYAMCTYDETKKIIGDSYAFIPKGKMQEKNRLERIRYEDFIAEGKCFACGDRIIDYGFVEEKILEVEERFKVTVMGVGFDRFNAISTANRLEKEAEFKTVEVTQMQSTLHMPTKLLQEKIINVEFAYTQNSLLEINFQNAKVAYAGQNMNMMITKKASSGKVDMVAALINAIYLMQQDVDFTEEEDGFLFQM